MVMYVALPLFVDASLGGRDDVELTLRAPVLHADDPIQKEHAEHLLETGGATRTADGMAVNPNGKAANFVWLLVVLMVTGAVICSIAIVQSTARDGGIH